MRTSQDREAPRRLVVAANRGPVAFHDDPDGQPIVTRGAGGLVTVLTAMLRKRAGQGAS